MLSDMAKNEAGKALGSVGWRDEGHNFNLRWLGKASLRKYYLNKVLEEGNDTKVALWVK